MFKHIFYILFLSTGLQLDAQINFEAEAPREVAANEQFNLVFTINADADNFQPPSLENFRILSGPSPSYMRRQINRDVFVQMSYTYLLMPKSTGEFTIGPASAEVKGKTYRTQSLNVKVNPSGSGSASNPMDLAEENAALRVILSKSKVYTGEPIVASYKLYFNNSVGNYNFKSEPEFTGFYTEKVDIDVKRIERENINGKMVNTAVLEQRVIIPQQIGKFNPGQVAMSVPTVVPVIRKNRFGQSFRVQQQINLDLEANVPPIEVLPLPEKGKPGFFSGAVGNFSMQAELSRDELSTDESLTLTITLKGRGNIKLTNFPEVEIPKAFETYDPEIKENIHISSGGMSGTKTIEYLLIPRYGGEYKIPAIKFSFFDPDSKSYKSLSSGELLVKVSGDDRPGSNITSQNRDAVDFLNRDILFIKTGEANLQKNNTRAFPSPVFYVLLAIFLLLPVFMIGYYKWQLTHKPDYASIKTGRAGKVARRHLKLAKKHLDARQNEEFYLALNTALWGYFSDRFNIPQSRISKELIREELHRYHIEEDLINRSINMMNRAEMARFTSVQTSDPGEDYAETAQIITHIENKL